MKTSISACALMFLCAAVPGSHGALCEKCRDLMFIMNIGKCSECGGQTTSGSHKLCPKCSLRLGECEHCRAKLGIAGQRREKEEKPGLCRLIDQKSDGKTVTLAPGEMVAVELPGNPTTGYSWQVAQIEGEAVRLKGNIAYRTGDKGPRKPIVGAGGVFRAEFQAEKPGRSTVVLEYRRPWEKDKPAAKTFSVTLVVRVADLNAPVVE